MSVITRQGARVGPGSAGGGRVRSRPLIVLLVVGLLAAALPFNELGEEAPAAAQDPDPCANVQALWCAELTANDPFNDNPGTENRKGCRPRSGRYCSSALTDDEFDFGGVTFYIGEIANSPPNPTLGHAPGLYLRFFQAADAQTARNSKGVLDPLHLCIGTSSLSFATASYASGDSIPQWADHTFGTWTNNQKVVMRIGWGTTCAATAPPRAVSLWAGPNPVVEGDPVTVRLSLNRSHTAALVVPLTLTAGTAESDDYGSLTSITIPSGSLMATGTVTTTADADSNDETFTVTVGTLPSEIDSASPSSVTVRILESGSTCQPDWCAVLTVRDLLPHLGAQGFGCDSRTLIITNPNPSQADRDDLERRRDDIWCARNMTDRNSPLGNILDLITGRTTEAGQLVLGIAHVSEAQLGGYRLHVDGVVFDLATASRLAHSRFVIPDFPENWAAGQKVGVRMVQKPPTATTTTTPSLVIPVFGGPAVSPAGRSSVSVEWLAAPGATGYEVAYKFEHAPNRDATTSNEPATGWVTRRVGASTRTTIGGLVQGLYYNVRVRSLDAVRSAMGPWSSWGRGAPGPVLSSGPATPLRLLSADRASVPEGPGLGQRVTITLRLAQPAPAGGLTVPLNASGSATLTGDFTWTPQITVTAGQRTGSTTLDTVNDSTHETAESVIVRLARVPQEAFPSSGAAVYRIESLRITITDDDAAPAVAGSSAEPNVFHTDPAVQRMAEQIAACAKAIQTEVDAWLGGTGSEQALRTAQTDADDCQFN